MPLATSHKTPAILSRREALSRALALMPLVAVPFGASAANKVGYLYVALELDHIDLRSHIDLLRPSATHIRSRPIPEQQRLTRGERCSSDG